MSYYGDKFYLDKVCINSESIIYFKLLKIEASLLRTNINFCCFKINDIEKKRVFLEKTAPYQKLKSLYPNANIVICSSSGQISNMNLVQNNLVATAIAFEKTKIKVTEIDILLNPDIKVLGKKILIQCNLYYDVVLV